MLRRLLDLVLGTQPRMRLRIRRSSLSWAVHVVCAALMAVGIRTGMFPSGPTLLLIGCNMLAVAIFYAIHRSRVSEWLTGADLMQIEGTYAVIAVACSYAILGPLRGTALTVMCSVFTFGAFVLSMRQSLRLAVLAMAILGAIMLWMVRSEPERYNLTVEGIHFALVSSMLLVISYLSGVLSDLRRDLARQKAALAGAVERIQELAIRDDLTGLYNRRHANALLSEERRQQDYGLRPLCLALLDIDRFKWINDEHGHAAGDMVLSGFARAMEQAMRSTDVLGSVNTNCEVRRRPARS